MPGQNPSVAEIVRLLPYRLQIRFGNLSGFVMGIIDETRSRLNEEAVIDRPSMELIQLAALIYSLDHFFRAGTRAATDSARTFERFGLSGFQVGSTAFTSNSPATMRGEELANALRATIAGTSLGPRIRVARSMSHLIESLVKDVINGKALD